MNLFDKEKAKAFSAIGFKDQSRHVKTLPQVKVKKLDIERDAARKALAPGKRISRTGKEYWETRSNRSDQIGTKL